MLPTNNPPAVTTAFLLRSMLGGTLMGLANLVPGISGGTMLLATGIYTDFIDAVANATRLRLDRRTLATLAAVGGAAAIAIVLFAGTVKDLVVDQRWLMYSLFIGLTLGGIPALWRIARPGSPALWRGAAAGFVVMAAVALAQATSAGTAGAAAASLPLLLFSGLAGAAAMILPGISGGYILLVLGQYVPILAAIERAVEAARALDIGALLVPVFSVVVPVGIGVVVGIVVVSNVLKRMLERHRAATLGVLLGLLAGCVVGLWPFQKPYPPDPGTTIKGQMVTAENAGSLDAEDWPLRRFDPTAVQVLISLGVIALGSAVTAGIAAIGPRAES